MKKWEYATAPLLAHNTKAILDNWGSEGWELVNVIPGPMGPESLVAYFKRPLEQPGTPADEFEIEAARIREAKSAGQSF